MYSQKLAAAIKVNGKILRELEDTVAIPFGTEYSIFVKNLNSVRALVRISIDGTDATENTSLIIKPNESIDLERFIKSGNLETGLRFKFIERTAKIEDGPRGIKVDDGLVRIEYEFERQPQPIVPQQIYDNNILRGINDPYRIAKGPYRLVTSDVFCMASACSAVGNSYSSDQAEVKTSSIAALNDVGITVGGSVSDQKFTTGSWFPTDGQVHSMIIRLFGEIGGKPVEKPVTVRTKTICPTCGTSNKSSAKFCGDCGTGLSIV
jgi:hypothetical protein